MPKERLSNVKIKEVLRLKFDADLSNRYLPIPSAFVVMTRRGWRPIGPRSTSR